jgi:hypothetical protein
MSQSPTRIVLARARGMIEDRRNWLQGGWSQLGGQGLVRRCAYQAVHDAALETGLPGLPALKLLTVVIGDSRRSPRRAIPMFNDTSRHEDVMAMFDLAIEQV